MSKKAHGKKASSLKNKRYIASGRRYKNKLKRVRQSCGEVFAREWEAKYKNARTNTR